MIHEDIVTYEVAKLAKEKGFSGDTRHIYDEETKELIECKFVANHNSEDEIISAPTQSLMQRWLREKKGLCLSVEAYPTLAIIRKVCFAWVIKSGSDGHFMESNDSLQTFYSYELALEDGLKYALENLVEL